MRQRVWIAGSLLVIAILCIIGWEKGLKPRSEKKISESSKVFPGFEPKLVKKIELARGSKKDILSARDSNWVVESEAGYQADAEGITKALESVKKLSCGTEVASGQEQFGRFDLDKENALEVKLYGEKNKLLADFYIGKRGATYSSSYFRKEGDDRICLAYENLITIFDRTNDTWRDKNILNFSAADCKTLKIADGETVIWLDKNLQENKWEMLEAQNKKPAASWAVDGICQTLSKLKTQGFPMVSPAQAGLEKTTKKITVSLVGGNQYTLLVGLEAKDTHNYYVKREDQPNIFELSSWQINSLFKKKDELLEKTIEETEPKDKTPTPPAVKNAPGEK
jgi:hypothetical protein